MATCPLDGAPLIATMAFPKAEFYCLECGGHFGFLDPEPAEPTPGRNAQYEALLAEFKAHAEPKLRVGRFWLIDCEKCKDHGEYHEAHATDEEREAHEQALAWLRGRAGEPSGA